MRWSGTHIMDWEIRKIDVDADGCFPQAYFKDNEQLSHIDSHKFPPSSIPDAYWVMNTFGKTRNGRSDINSDLKCECTVTTRNLK